MSALTAKATTQPCLHLLAAPGRTALESCVSQCEAGDTVFFLAGGVTCLAGDDLARFGAAGVRLLFSGADVRARGLQTFAERAGVELADDDRLAELVCGHHHCLTWK